MSESGEIVDPEGAGIDRRKAIGAMVAGAGAAWTAPSVLRMSKAGAATGSTPTTTTTIEPPTGDAVLRVNKTGPGGAFTDQEFSFNIEVSNIGDETATSVELIDDLPDEGSFVSSSPSGSVAGGVLTVALGDIAPGDSEVVTVVWRAPSDEGTVVNSARASADNAAASADSAAAVQIGSVTITDGGVASAGTGLRNRDGGTIEIVDVPGDATVTRAVLVWALLYNGNAPGNQITLDGNTVTADLTATISENLCWGDTETIGYAADVTSLVTGNGSYVITDAINGQVRVDDQPTGTLPYTDGASLIVFYGGAGYDDQVISDFTYSAENTGSNVRQLAGINSVGGAATLHLAGPDGQNNAGEVVDITGSSVLSLPNSWDGSAPQDGPSFTIGNLWDNDVIDVSSILPAGQTTLNVDLGNGGDCTGLSAVVLSVQQ